MPAGLRDTSSYSIPADFGTHHFWKAPRRSAPME